MKEMVSYIVVNHNGKELLSKCLASVFSQTHPQKEVIVIDNHSSDGSVQMLKNKYPQVKLIENSKNLMLAKAYNQGIKLASADYLLCLNNDVVLERDYTQEVLTKFKLDSQIGAVAGKLIDPLSQRIDSSGQFLSRSRRAYERGYRAPQDTHFPQGYIWGVAGACALYRREMLEEIQIRGEYFDESYGAYLEDLDLNWRMRKFGWKAYFAPRAIAYHYRGSTGWKRKTRLGYLNLSPELKLQLIKNRYSSLLKNETFIELAKNLPFIAIYEAYLWFFLLLESPKSIIEFMKDKKWLKEALEKRKIILSRLNSRRKKWLS